MVLVLLADGFEEIEALMPVDLLKRAKIDVKTCGIDKKTVISTHNIKITCDISANEADLSDIEMLILPGGMPGSVNLDKSEFTNKAILKTIENGGHLAAICAAPLVLGRRGLLVDKAACCYPGFENELIGAKISKEKVVTDKNVTTARGMGVALDFAKELVRIMTSKECAEEISSAIME